MHISEHMGAVSAYVFIYMYVYVNVCDTVPIYYGLLVRCVPVMMGAGKSEFSKNRAPFVTRGVAFFNKK